MSDQDLLRVYLQDHLAGATAGLNLAQRLASEHGGATLAAVAREIESDRATLGEVMAAIDVGPHQLKNAIAWAGERAGRLKLNDRIFGRSPLSSVLELEGLITGVSGKLQLWRALELVAASDSRLEGFGFPELARRAEDQRRRLEKVHAEAATGALRD